VCDAKQKNSHCERHLSSSSCRNKLGLDEVELLNCSDSFLVDDAGNYTISASSSEFSGLQPVTNGEGRCAPQSNYMHPSGAVEMHDGTAMGSSMMGKSDAHTEYQVTAMIHAAGIPLSVLDTPEFKMLAAAIRNGAKLPSKKKAMEIVQETAMDENGRDSKKFRIFKESSE
jgi:hypothetical protein